MSFWLRKIRLLQSNKEKWILVAFIGLFVPFFLIVFQPFGVNNFDPNNTISPVFFFSMVGFGAVVACVLAIFEFLVAPFIFKEETMLIFCLKWTVELVFIAFAAYLFYNILGGFHDWNLISFLDFVFNITVMALIPIAIILLYYNYQASKHAYKLIEQAPKILIDKEFISLSSYNYKEQLTLPLINLLYMEAQDNYVAIHYIEKDRVKKHLLRNKLSKMETELKNYGILRCHRSFLVNCSNIENVLQSGQKTELILKMTSRAIPVSKSYLHNINSFFSTHHK